MEHIDNDPAPVCETSLLSFSAKIPKRQHPSVPIISVPSEPAPPSLRRSRSWKDLKDSSKTILREITQLGPVSPRAMREREKQATQLTGPYLLRKPSKEIAKASDQLKLEQRQDLSKRLDGKSGFPWEDIAATGDADLIESLLNLYTISLSVFAHGPDAELIMMLAMDIVNRSKRKSVLGGENSQNYALAIIGMLIDYVSTDPNGAAKLSGGKEYHESIEKIKNRFKQRLESSQEVLKKLYLTHTEFGLQNPELACIRQIPNEIAKLLIPAPGIINFGIISSIKEAYVKEDNPLNYQINLYYGLAHLKYHHELRHVISKIHKPSNDKDPGNFVVRCTQNLSLKDPVTDLHAQRTALSAILSHLRQQPNEDSCFTTSIAIELMTFNLGCCAKDFLELLENSKLSRLVNNRQVDFPFVLHMNGENLDNRVKIDSDGRIIDGLKRAGYLWDAPSIRGVCQAIGIEDSKSAIKQIFMTKGGSFIRRANSLSIREILHQLSALSPACKEFGQNELFTRACFFYDSLTTCHPLLRVWENSLAGMSEASEKGIMKTAIIDSVIKVFREYAGLTAKDLKWNDSEFEKMIVKELLQQGQLQYDPNIEKKGSLDSKSIKGAFVIYQQSPSQNSLRRMRIDSYELYQEFIKIVLESVIYRLPKSERTSKENEPYINFLNNLVKYVQTDHFISSNLEYYHDENQKLIEISTDYANFRYAPWVTRIGNNPKTILKVYYEIDQLPETEIFRPKTEMDLLCKFIDLRRNATPRTKDLSKNPFYLQPVRRPGMHAFSALAGELVIPDHITTLEWINRSIILPGLDVAFSPIQPHQRDELIKFVLGKYLDLNEKQFAEKMLKHISINTSIREFRDLILSVVSKNDKINAAIGISFENELDLKIYATLPKELKTKLENASFQVADSNMPEGVHDIRYCFTVNPGTGNLTFWECLDDKTLIKLLDANKWLLNQSWEFYRHPQNANESPRLN